MRVPLPVYAATCRKPTNVSISRKDRRDVFAEGLGKITKQVHRSEIFAGHLHTLRTTPQRHARLQLLSWASVETHLILSNHSSLMYKRGDECDKYSGHIHADLASCWCICNDIKMPYIYVYVHWANVHCDDNKRCQNILLTPVQSTRLPSVSGSLCGYFY